MGTHNPPFKRIFISHMKVKKVECIIWKNTNTKKTPGFDSVTGKVLKDVSSKSLKSSVQWCSIQVFNAELGTKYFPLQPKIIVILKASMLRILLLS